MPAKIDDAVCSGCESCVTSCPTEAISMKNGVAVVNVDDCVECGACVGECPVDAISME